MTANDPIVSVIVPAYQAERTIDRTLRSLIAQTDPRWAAVVVDDGSSDKTVQVARSVGDKRVSVVSVDRAGVSAARNIGFAISTAPLVCFLDADDTLEKEYFGVMIPAAQSGSLGAACGYRYVNVEGQSIHEVPAPSSDLLGLDRLLRLDPPAIMSLLHRRDVLGRAASRGLVFDPSQSAFEDWDVLRRISEANPGIYSSVQRPLASYHCTPNSLSEDVERTLNAGIALLRTHGDPHPDLAERIREHRLRCLGASVIANRDCLARSIQQDLVSLEPSDAEVIGSAVEWSAMRRWGLSEGKLAGRRAKVIRLAEEMLGDPGVLRQVCSRIDGWGDDIWGDVLRRAEEAAGLRGRVVVFGAGRNGLRATTRAKDLGITCVVADDDPDRSCPGFESILLDEIGAADVVVMTPDRSDDVVRRLRDRGVTRILIRQGQLRAGFDS